MSVIDLFAGPGGWDVAAKRVGVDPIGLEWDDAACATRRAADLRTMQCDVAAVDLNAGWIGSKYNGLIASPPCQAWSSAGKGDGLRDQPRCWDAATALLAGKDIRAKLAADCTDPRSLLIVEPLRWALALRPEWIALEQVPGVLPFWRFIAHRLETLGYSTWTGILNAANYGVPQTRERAILIASRVLGVGPPAPTHSDQRKAADLFGELKPWITMAEAVGWGVVDEPAGTLVAGSNRTGGVSPVDGGSGARERYREAQRTGRWLSVDRRQTGAPVVNGSEWPAPTITGAAFGKRVWNVRWVHERPATTVCGDPRIGRPGHKNREHGESQFAQDSIVVSVEEAAALQTFPPGYPWQGNKREQHLQIGNAVPPLLAEHILRVVVPVEAQELAA